jgi:hypothetical protein
MSWLVREPAVLQRELQALAYEAASWSDRESRSRMQAVFKRAHMNHRGDRVEYGGLQVDPRYRMRSSTIIEWLEIAPEEERQMQTLISEDERRRRDRERDEKRRREAGSLPRDEYLSIAASNRREAHRLRSEGYKQKEIAKALGLSERWVRELLKQKPEQSLRLYGGVAAPVGRPLR